MTTNENTGQINPTAVVDAGQLPGVWAETTRNEYLEITVEGLVPMPALVEFLYVEDDDVEVPAEVAVTVWAGARMVTLHLPKDVRVGVYLRSQ